MSQPVHVTIRRRTIKDALSREYEHSSPVRILTESWMQISRCDETEIVAFYTVTSCTPVGTYRSIGEGENMLPPALGLEPEDADVFLRNVGIYLQEHTVPQLRWP
jgi:hypothetical protein